MTMITPELQSDDAPSDLNRNGLNNNSNAASATMDTLDEYMSALQGATRQTSAEPLSHPPMAHANQRSADSASVKNNRRLEALRRMLATRDPFFSNRSMAARDPDLARHFGVRVIADEIETQLSNAVLTSARLRAERNHSSSADVEGGDDDIDASLAFPADVDCGTRDGAFLRTMCNRFLRGEDAEFDYRMVDQNDLLDFNPTALNSAEELYFDSDAQSDT